MPISLGYTCGITDTDVLKSARPIFFTSMPSMTMSPVGSTNRRRLTNNVDFPAPVLPTTPTYGDKFLNKSSVCTVLFKFKIFQIDTISNRLNWPFREKVCA